MSKLKDLRRSKTIRNGEIHGPGESVVDVERNIRDQQNTLKNPHKNFEDWERLHKQLDSITGRYELYKNETLGKKNIRIRCRQCK